MFIITQIIVILYQMTEIQEDVSVQSFNPFRIKFMKNDAHAHMNDLSIINLVLY